MPSRAAGSRDMPSRAAVSREGCAEQGFSEQCGAVQGCDEHCMKLTCVTGLRQKDFRLIIPRKEKISKLKWKYCYSSEKWGVGELLRNLILEKT